MLKYETFVNGLTLIKKCYLGFDITSEDGMAWYQIIKSSIEEDTFLPLIVNYCKSEPVPTCPADLIRFGKKMLIDASPAPALIADSLIEATEIMIHDFDFNNSEPSKEDEQEYLISQLLFKDDIRGKTNKTVIIVIVKYFCGSLVRTVRRNNPTDISVLTSEIKTAYKKELDKTVSNSVLSANLLEGVSRLLIQ